MDAAEIMAVYTGSDGDATKALYEKLRAVGAAGEVALNVFRAHKNSARAKVYRGGVRGQGSYKSMAYERKAWAMDNLCIVLAQHGAALGVEWGWGRDEKAVNFEDVLYVDLPSGQVSFHTAGRGAGPNYSGGWDGVKDAGPQRIANYAESVLAGTVARVFAGEKPAPPVAEAVQEALL